MDWYQQINNGHLVVHLSNEGWRRSGARGGQQSPSTDAKGGGKKLACLKHLHGLAIHQAVGVRLADELV